MSNIWSHALEWSDKNISANLHLFHDTIRPQLLVSTVWGWWSELSVFHMSKNWGNSSSSVGARLKRWAKSTPKWRSSWPSLWIRKEPSGACPAARWSRKPRPANSHSRWASKELTPADLLSPPSHTIPSALPHQLLHRTILKRPKEITLELGCNTCFSVKNIADVQRDGFCRPTDWTHYKIRMSNVKCKMSNVCGEKKEFLIRTWGDNSFNSQVSRTGFIRCFVFLCKVMPLF